MLFPLQFVPSILIQVLENGDYLGSVAAKAEFLTNSRLFRKVEGMAGYPQVRLLSRVPSWLIRTILLGGNLETDPWVYRQNRLAEKNSAPVATQNYPMGIASDRFKK